jgi:hypothetical protein
MKRVRVRKGKRSRIAALAVVFVALCVAWHGRFGGSADPQPAQRQGGISYVARASAVPPVALPPKPARPVAQPRPRSFSDRFALALGRYDLDGYPHLADEAPAPSENHGNRALAARAAQGPRLASLEQPGRTVDAPNNSLALPAIEPRTAIYDIAAHAVYLPNGERLEAHSGLGSNMDNPHTVSLKNRGVTPTNVYDLVLRRPLFHGVQAIRLVPTDENKMHGRGGMLAHSYMLGRNGQSNGCVSFRDYPAFLHAFLRGEVERLVVVDHLASAPAKSRAISQNGFRSS